MPQSDNTQPHNQPAHPPETLPYQSPVTSRDGQPAVPLPGPRRGAPPRKRKQSEFGGPGEWAWVLFAAALLGMTVIVSVGLFFILQATQGDDALTSDESPVVEPTSVLYGVGGVLEDVAPADQPVGGLLGDAGQSMVINAWDGKERFTVLVMGMDRRPGEAGAAFRTDTMILISLDPVAKRVGMMSIPRDLYVDVPGYGLQRVNSAYGVGERAQPGGGPRLAMQTVQYNFGIPVNEYVVVDFNTFIRVIDLIGGITVDVPHAISDPQYPDMNFGYDPFYIATGAQSLDGATALKYARSRHGTDDIDRARRQQQVLYAIRDKVIDLDMIPELALEAPVLWSEMSAGIDTGLALDQIVQLAWWVKDIPRENFTNGVVGWEYVYSQNWQGQDILVPSRARIGALMVEIFGPDYNPYR